MRTFLAALSLCVLSSASAVAEVRLSIGTTLPGLDIGIEMSDYPDLVPIPGYPVYYAPRANLNYFFYDGWFWVFADDAWYASRWYDGPWQIVEPDEVPLFLLRVPVRYYRRPPMYFRAWRWDAPPRWGDHWGRGWERRHEGWDRWERRAAPPPAPLPRYQQRFSGERYPHDPRQQRLIREQQESNGRPRAAPERPNAPPPRQEAPAPRRYPEPGYPAPNVAPDRGRPQPVEPNFRHQPPNRPDFERPAPNAAPDRGRPQPVEPNVRQQPPNRPDFEHARPAAPPQASPERRRVPDQNPQERRDRQERPDAGPRQGQRPGDQPDRPWPNRND